MKVAIVCNVKPQESFEFEHPEEPPGSIPLSEEKYAEWDSAKTIKAIAEALRKRYDVFIVIVNNIKNKINMSNYDFVFNIAEGLKGSYRESLIPAMLEELNIPYTGSDPLTLSICLDKARTKEILSFYKIPTPKFFVFYSKEDLKKIKINFMPAIVKPLREGSSIGVYNDNICYDVNTLKIKIEELLEKLKEPVIVEKFLQGREFTVAVLGNYPDLEILPIVEIDFSALPKGANPIYSYEAKWIWDNPEKPLKIFKAPAELEKNLERKIKKIIFKTFKVLRIRDWCRIDIRLDEKGVPNILEVNPLPGIIPGEEENSCFPKAARAAGMSYEDLILKVMEIARKRYERSCYSF